MENKGGEKLPGTRVELCLTTQYNLKLRTSLHNQVFKSKAPKATGSGGHRLQVLVCACHLIELKLTGC